MVRSQSPHLYRRYGAAVLAILLATLLRLLLNPALGARVPFITMIAALAFVGWYGGLGPALAATILGALAAAYFFIPPDGFAVAGPVSGLGLMMFVLVGFVIAVFSGLTHAARRLADREHEELKITLASIGDAVIATDIHGHVTFLNGVAQLLTGWGESEAHGQPLGLVFPILHEETRQPVENPVAKVLKHGKVVGLGNHTVLISRDGTERPIDDSAAPIRDADGTMLGVVLVFRDVTEQRRAENQLRQSEGRKSAILETALDCIFTLDQDGKILECNPAAEEIFGFPREQIVEKELSSLIDPIRLQDPEVLNLYSPLSPTQASLLRKRREMTAVRADGTSFPIEFAVTRIPHEDPPMFTAYLRDITEQKWAERQRNTRLAVNQVLNQATEISAAIRQVLQIVCENLEWEAGFSWWLDEQQQVLSCRESWQASRTELPSLKASVWTVQLARGEGLPGRVWEAGRSMWLANLAEEPEVLRARPGLGSGLKTAFAFPLQIKAQTLGVIEVVSTHPRQADERLLELMDTVANSLDQFLEGRRADEKLREQTLIAETLNRIGGSLTAELDLQRLVQLVTDEGTRLCGAHFGAFFYNIVGESGEAYTLYTLSGVPPEAFSKFPMPRNTELFGPTFRGEGIVRVGDILEDPRFGKNEPYFGMPEGHLPVRSYLALPVMSRSGDVLGGLFFGHAEVGMFSERHEQLLRGLAGQAAVAIDNARLYQEAQSAADHLSLAVTAANLGDWKWDARTDLVTFSPRGSEIFGIPQSPLSTWTQLQELIHPDDRERVQREVERVVRTGEHYDIEYRVVRENGTQVWVTALGQAVESPDGKPRGMFGIVRDITERKRLEESLRNSEGRFRGLVEQAPFSIQVFHPDGRTISVNNAWEELWGLHLDDLESYNVLQDPQLDSKGIRPYLERAFQGEATYIPAIKYNPEETLPDANYPDNPVRWVSAVAYPLRDETGQVREVVLVHEDITARKKTESALRESEEKLRLLADSISQLTWMANPDGFIFWYNQQWYDYTGTTPEEMEGWGWQSVLDPQVLPAVMERWQQTLETGERFEMVFPLRGADGRFRDFLTQVNPLRDEQQRILYWFGTNTDITELKEARESLAASEERLRLALDAGRMGVWDWNLRTNELKWSDSLEPLHGLAPGTFDGTFEGFQKLIHPEDREYVMHAIGQTVESGGSYDIEFRNIWPNGTIHWIAGKGQIFEDLEGQPARMIGVGMDVTQRKRAEQTARFLADVSATLAVLVDFDSTLQKLASLAVPYFADWATVDLLEGEDVLRRVAVSHWDPGKVQLAHEVQRRFPPNPDAPQGVWNILRTGQPEIVSEITDELLVQAVEDPELLQIMRELGLKSYLGVPLKLRGKTIGVITFISAESSYRYDAMDLAVAQDLADRAGIAIDNAQLYRELREADRRKDEFLAILAHELRNPLAPIRTGLEIMKMIRNEPETIEEIRGTMERQVEQMITLVNDLLDVSRITRGKLELRRCQVILSDVLQSAVEASRPFITEAGHQLIMQLPENPLQLNADPHRLAQIFSNLLNNAAKYTPEGGKIWLSARQLGDEVEVSVRDNGIGIPVEMQEQIFKMFAQIDRPMEKSYTGLGIGLTLVKSLVEMHQGQIQVQSQGAHQGSEFRVQLPILSTPSAEAPTQDQPKDQIVTNVRRKVLVVDDNTAAAQMLSMVVGMLGNEVQTAGDGLEATKVAEQFRPQIIFMDLGMPRMNGYDAARAIRKQPWGREILLIALTGWGQEEDRRKTREAGFDHHYVKPVDPSVLQQIFESYRPPMT